MELFDDLHYLAVQLQQLNVCQMYLQVTMVAEITNHMGATILPQVLN